MIYSKLYNNLRIILSFDMDYFNNKNYIFFCMNPNFRKPIKFSKIILINKIYKFILNYRILIIILRVEVKGS